MRDKNNKPFILQELAYYSVDLRARAAGTPATGQSSSDICPDITFEYLRRVPSDLFKTLGFTSNHQIDEHTTCLIARHQNIPIGGRLFNLQGKAKHHYPFSHEMVFPQKHVYGFGFFLKQEFRGKGIGKRIHLESERMLHDAFDCMDILIEQGNYIAIRNAEGLGFRKIKTFIFFKIFSLKWVFNVAPGFSYQFYKAIFQLCRLGWRFVSGLPRAMKAAFRWAYGIKEDLLLTSYTIQSASPDANLTGIFICRHKPDPAILNKLFPDGCEARKNKVFFRMNLSNEFTDTLVQTDFIIADVRFRHVRQRLSGFHDAHIIPKWVEQKNLNFNGLSDFAGIRKNDASRDIRLTSKYNYDYEFTKDAAILKFFYDRMYCPYMHVRYPDEKVVASFDGIRKEFLKGGLILLKDTAADQYIAGSVVNLQNSTLTAVKLGVLDGDPALLQKRAVSALYISYFKFMEKNNIRRFHLGASRPFLNDGVLKYKAKWGTVIDFDKRRGNVLILRICRPSKHIDHFLLNNPFISLVGEEMIGNIFVTEDDRPSDDDLTKDYRFKGISKLQVSRVNTTACVQVRVNDQRP